MADLGTFWGTNSLAFRINDSGQVVGYADLAGNTANHAFRYSGGVMVDLGTLGGTYSFAQGINSLGQVVGYSDTPTASRGFVYNGGSMTPLGTLGGSNSAAYGINASGQIVRFSSKLGNLAYHAFRYSGGIMTDLGHQDISRPPVESEEVQQILRDPTKKDEAIKLYERQTGLDKEDATADVEEFLVGKH